MAALPPDSSVGMVVITGEKPGTRPLTVGVTHVVFDVALTLHMACCTLTLHHRDVQWKCQNRIIIIISF